MSLSILRGWSGCCGQDDKRDAAMEDCGCRMVELWLFAKRGIVLLAASGGWNVIVRQMRHCCDWLAVAWRLKDGCGGAEVSDGRCEVGKRLCSPPPAHCAGM